MYFPVTLIQLVKSYLIDLDILFSGTVRSRKRPKKVTEDRNKKLKHQWGMYSRGESNIYQLYGVCCNLIGSDIDFNYDVLDHEVPEEYPGQKTDEDEDLEEDDEIAEEEEEDSQIEEVMGKVLKSLFICMKKTTKLSK